MDFNDSPQEASFREAARAWLAANAQPRRTATDTFAAGTAQAERLHLARQWQDRKARAGYAAITWPIEYGGLGASPVMEVIYRQEQARFVTPFGFFEVGLGMCIPTLLAYASAADKARYVKPALHGEEIWCQLFSEPCAGSDLAGIRTRARPTTGGWIVSGQKAWTTGAQFSNFGLLLARTHPEARKHAGLTMFFLDMKSPGVQVRPIRQLSGDSEFNEVFFDNVYVPDTQRLGDVQQGWKVALTTLMFERLTVGTEIGLIDHRALLALARRVTVRGRPALQDPATRERLAMWYLNDEGLRLLNCRAITALSRGCVPGPEQSINKIVAASQAQEIASYAFELLGEAGVLSGADLPPEWQGVERSWALSAGMRIAGGTDEILRNVIAERVLGLPAEIRVDKDLPFDQLPC